MIDYDLEQVFIDILGQTITSVAINHAMMPDTPELVLPVIVVSAILESRLEARELLYGFRVNLEHKSQPGSSNPTTIQSVMAQIETALSSNPTKTITGNTHSTITVDGLSSTANLVVGNPISGTGIPAGATIASINVAGSSLTLSSAATATANGVSLTVTTIPASVSKFSFLAYHGVNHAEHKVDQDRRHNVREFLATVQLAANLDA